ncbi:unnamed protein product, partial [Ixodes pacificus]
QICPNFHVDKPANFIKEKKKKKTGSIATLNISCVQKLFFCHILCYSAWLNEDEAPVAVRMNSYLKALLGMGTSDTDDEAEAYQLANYGTGGQFLPHHDFLQDSLHSYNSSADYYLQYGTGDRLATLMIYMTDVEEGGATVFPSLGIRLTPKKGDAAFWWNLKASGEGDRLTMHAGCPVLYGSKWSEFQ